MKRYLRKWILLLLILIVFKYNPAWTERFYSLGVYVILRNIDLFFLRFVPFSLGDILYIGIFFRLIVRSILLLSEKNFKLFLRFWGNWIWKIIFWFYMAWGLNYFRLPLYQNLDLKPMKPTREQLMVVGMQVADTLNKYHFLLQRNDSLPVENPHSLRELTLQARQIYQNNASVWPYFSQPYYVVKPSVFSPLISYGQILGYFNPYTHEAQINTLYPSVYKPHVILHELAHQTGYANETEAEFIAFLEADNSGNKLFKYAVYLTAFEYLLQHFRQNNRNMAKFLLQKLRPGIRENLAQARRFHKQYRLSVDTSKPYDIFLKLNQQGKGMESYSEMIRLLSAYMLKKSSTSQ